MGAAFARGGAGPALEDGQWAGAALSRVRGSRSLPCVPTPAGPSSSSSHLSIQLSALCLPVASFVAGPHSLLRPMTSFDDARAGAEPGRDWQDCSGAAALPERLASLHADKHHCMAAIWSQQLSHEKHVRLLEDSGALLWQAELGQRRFARPRGQVLQRGGGEVQSQQGTISRRPAAGPGIGGVDSACERARKPGETGKCLHGKERQVRCYIWR